MDASEIFNIIKIQNPSLNSVFLRFNPKIFGKCEMFFLPIFTFLMVTIHFHRFLKKKNKMIERPVQN